VPQDAAAAWSAALLLLLGDFFLEQRAKMAVDACISPVIDEERKALL
jgi:hypothetical protein